MVVGGEILLPSVMDIGLGSFTFRYGYDAMLRPISFLFFSTSRLNFSDVRALLRGAYGSFLATGKVSNAASDEVIMFLRESFTLLPQTARSWGIRFVSANPTSPVPFYKTQKS